MARKPKTTRAWSIRLGRLVILITMQWLPKPGRPGRPRKAKRNPPQPGTPLPLE